MTKWSHRALGPRVDGVNVEEAVSITDNKLVITTSKVGDEYHTGMIGTQGKFETKYGYFETRVRFQTQVGHWSAFWLQSPLIYAESLDTSKYGAEIDIYEYIADEGIIRQAVHWGGYNENHQKDTNQSTELSVADGWHVIGLLWEEDKYTFIVDDIVVWERFTEISKINQYIILSMEVGPFGGNIANATLPDSVEFDYVRVYKKD